MKGWSKLAAVLVISLFALNAGAAYLYSWPVSPTVPDADDGLVLPAQDILDGMWYAQDSTHHYFRMDIEDTPAPTGYSGVYGIYIDSIGSQGANGGDFSYVPSALDGIDYILDYHYDPTLGNEWHFHIWVPDANAYGGGNYVYGTLDGYQQTENSGRTIEWKIAKSKISGVSNFEVWGATHDDGSQTTTYDYAPGSGAGYTVPEPATMALLGLGSLVFIARRKK